MQLLGDFFTISSESATDTGFEIRIVLNPEHQIYKAHFPGHPVTPGVIQIRILHELIEKHLGYKIRLREISDCKFLKIISPSSPFPLWVKAGLLFSDNLITVKAQGLNESDIYFKIKATYGADQY